MEIPTVDLIIILAYLAVIIAIEILSARKKKTSSEGFFLAGRSLHWGMIGAALFAANISTIHMVVRASREPANLPPRCTGHFQRTVLCKYAGLLFCSLLMDVIVCL